MNSALGYRTVESELIGAGDGVAKVWPLRVAGDIVRNVAAAPAPVIYRDDWQGRVILSNQPRTNYVGASNDFGQWDTVSGAVVVGQVGPSPDDRIKLTEIQGNHSAVARVIFPLDIPAAGNYRLQIVVAQGTSESVMLAAGSGAGTAHRATLKFIGGIPWVESSGGVAVVQIDPLPNGTYAVSFTLSIDTAGAGNMCILPDRLAVSGSVYVGFAGLYDTGGAYIPTSTGPVTVTDYHLSASAQVVLPEPLREGAKLIWSGELFPEVASLLPPNATRAERAMEAATARAFDLPTPAREVWNPDTCPAELLPWLAWAFSIDAWKSYWPEHIKRSRIRNAIEIQRHKGTAASVRRAVESFGGAVVLREWHQQEPPGAPYTFDMTLTLSGEGGAQATAEFVDDVINEVARTKPVRAHFTFTQGVESVGAIGIIAGARACICRRLNFEG